MTNDLYIRGYIDNISNSKHTKKPTVHNKNIRLIIDTETTIDAYQNLSFGSCLIETDLSTGTKEDWYIFYGDINDKDKVIITEYSKTHNITVMHVTEFIDSVFYRYAYLLRAEVIGFNFPFDISRLAYRYYAQQHNNGFTFELSHNLHFPRVKIQSLDSKRSFISFTNAAKSHKRNENYRGFFVDLRTLTFALTDRSYTLDGACKDFGASLKLHVEEHGKITTDYINYNVQDVRSTAELYQKALERYRMFNLSKEVNDLYSPASIGKAYLEAMNIRPFLELNPKFPKSLIGKAMSSYFGGRTEAQIVHMSVPVTYLDFLSMYPSVYSLLGLDRVLKTNKIYYYSNTEAVRKFVNDIKIDDVADKNTWRNETMLSIVKIKPKDDILPIRLKNREAKNISVNYLTTDKALWYTIQDVIASKILTGKAPEILEAITFKPIGIQENLKDASISDITIGKHDDFIKTLIEQRMIIKTSTREDKDQIQLILKIIANSTAYGIYIETNENSLKNEKEAKMYADEAIDTISTKIEQTGKYFNPTIATLITSSARLILATAEKIAKDNGYVAYMDSDSVMVDPKVVDKIQGFFKQLNPYSVDVDMFKIEEAEGIKLENVLIYAISAKRYCLYRKNDNGDIQILKASLHGLGMWKNVNDKEIWKDIITQNITDKYENTMCVSQLTISTKNVLKRFKIINRGKPISKHIRPFNFILTGKETDSILPMIPYRKNIANIQYSDFVDKTGKHYSGISNEQYFTNMRSMLADYVRHNDHKYLYINGFAIRKHITVDKIRYTGKETSNVEIVSKTGGITKQTSNEYVDVKDRNRFIIKLQPKDVKDIGISRDALWYVKQRIASGKILNTKTKIVSKLIELYNQ